MIARNDDGMIALDKRAQHNIVVLTIAQALNYALAPLTMAIGGLAGTYLLDADKTFATLPITCFILGPLLGAFPAAMLMKQAGRRIGFLLGSVIGFIGCAAAAFAILKASFAGFCLAALGIGVSIAFAQQYRFAAADFGSAALRVRGLSWVMGGGLVAAVVGPQTAIAFNDFFAPVVFAGSFVGGMILSAIGFCVLLLLKSAPASKPSEMEEERAARPLLAIIKQPVFLTAFLCAATSYMAMSLVMTAAPLAMILCGFTSDQSTTAIQFHIMAMFAPSFFTGSLIVRFGHTRIIATGLALFFLCSLIALSGIDLANFWAALIALGIAWNFGYIGGTSLVTKTYQPQERSKVQGIFDSLVFGSAAMTSLLSGVLLSMVGWNLVLAIVLPLVFMCAIIIWAQRSRLQVLPI